VGGGGGGGWGGGGGGRGGGGAGAGAPAREREKKSYVLMKKLCAQVGRHNIIHGADTRGGGHPVPRQKTKG
jgi:hypothetical protein